MTGMHAITHPDETLTVLDPNDLSLQHRVEGPAMKQGSSLVRSVGG